MSVTPVAEKLSPVKTGDGIVLTRDKIFDDYEERHPQASLIWAPGGVSVDLEQIRTGSPVLDFVRRNCTRAGYATSVREGALILAAAGLLDGLDEPLQLIKLIEGGTVAESVRRKMNSEARGE